MPYFYMVKNKFLATLKKSERNIRKDWKMKCFSQFLSAHGWRKKKNFSFVPADGRTAPIYPAKIGTSNRKKI
jgi:hypothetical protein